MTVRTGIRISGFPVETTETDTTLTVTTEGAKDLILSTNDGTDSGTITIEDGTSGDINIDVKKQVHITRDAASYPNGTKYALNQPLIIEDDNRPGIQLTGSANNIGIIEFGDDAHPNAGTINFDHSTNRLRFGFEDDAEKVYIDNSGNMVISGDLTVNGATATVSTTNTVIEDKIIELGNGVTGTPSGDAGVIIERGSSDNAAIVWDESRDEFVLGTTSATGASTGDLTVTPGNLSVERIGAGTEQAEAEVHAKRDAASGVQYSTTATVIAEDDARPSIQLAGAANNIGLIQFGDNAAVASGQIYYDHSTDKLRVDCGGSSDRLTVDSSGNVNIAGELQATNIGYTDGDNAITIADGGACTFAAGITSTASGNTFGTTTLGATTADSLSVDNISINGTEIDLSSGDLTIDVAGDIKLDAGGADIEFLNAGTEFGLIGADGSNNMLIESTIQDKDILFKGDDGGSEITALTLDMSEEGAATFNSSVTVNGPIAADGSLTVSGATPRVTIGSGGEGDSNLLFDGHAADFRIGIDDGTDSLEIGAGTAHGTTAAIIVDSSGEVTKIGQDSPSNDDVLSWDGSNNKVIWSARSGGGGGGAVASVSNGSNNRIATFTSSDDLNGEANLEFDGTDLSIGGAGKLEFRDTGIHISSDEDGHLQITADAHVTTSGFPSNENAIGTSATSLPSIFSADGDYTGDTIKLLNDTTVKGHIYYLSDHPGWTEAQADNTSDGGAGEMLAMAVGTNSNTHGMLVKGFMRIDSGNYNGTADIGKIGYLSDDTAGQIDFTAPDESGEVVRVLGHCLQKDGSNHILFYFNPSNDYVEIA